MNAMPVSQPDFIQDQINVSDSDTNLDEDDASEYYQPISAVDDDDHDDNDDNDEDRHGDQNGYGNDVAGLHSHLHSNGYRVRQAENGVSSLGLNDDVERSSKSSSEDEEEEEEEEEDDEERMREAADSAVVRAFREDENRRNAPLTTENAMRVMEAMRGVSFGGVAPDWADRVAENNWVDQLRRLRHPPQA
ncbi:hypothetical protein PanWU01x14_023530 [Parasponia andersonii]|uniref:Uncharacterized protein n=1 Tax=Parasponia andersonii TaxID=3476 RepID=A0A2P5DXK0_PARAD|nr:hypothetical protein PanWU01x14_023530 [Parasponia andersonii]